MLNLGDPVYSAWWPDNDWQQPATWWPGTITAFDVRYDVDHGYGPLRLYGIRFDDGDVLNNVEDVYVFPKEEYELTTSSDEQHCMVRNIVDANAQDQWARIVGWYEFSGEQGSVRSFPLLRDALDAYHQPIASNRSSPQNGACNDISIHMFVGGGHMMQKESSAVEQTVPRNQLIDLFSSTKPIRWAQRLHMWMNCIFYRQTESISRSTALLRFGLLATAKYLILAYHHLQPSSVSSWIRRS